MQYQIDSFQVLANNKTPLKELVEQRYQVHRFELKILKHSIDARKKTEVYHIYRLLLITDERLKGKNVTLYHKERIKPSYPVWKEEYPPVIVGFGPAGIFASLYLARCGARPIILERGSRIEERVLSVDSFFKNKKLSLKSNVQFGEGGAGAFSDGKLNTNVKSPYIDFILEELYKHGAKEDILYEHMPHIGTDVLRRVVKNIREEIIALGGTFYFNTAFQTIKQEADYGLAITEHNSFKTRHILLGIGHSAKDTIRHLFTDAQVKMEPKAFSMGVRVEHLAKDINQAQYGKYAAYLPPAYYKLSLHTDGRGIYTFCMCPGGYVLPSQSEPHTIVTNGMSNQRREGLNSNSAILVDVRPSDYGKNVLDGLDYQEKYERLAYEVGQDYRAPANLMKEFMENQVALETREIQTTYPHGLIFCDFKKCLPDFVVEGIKEGIEAFEQKMKGFYHPDAILIGIESRSSSPVRIIRDQDRKASIPFLYPIGEGAGYAGGITSAALDGLKTAMLLAKEEKKEV